MGSRIHAALETDDFSILHNDWEVKLAEACVSARANMLTHLKFTPKETHREIRLDIDLGQGVHTFGTSDELMINGDTGVKIDWKTGRNGVDPAETNVQAQAYVLGAFQKFSQLETLHFIFILPQRDEISYATYTRADMERIQTRLRSIVLNAMSTLQLFAEKADIPPGLLNPQSKVCCYCANIDRCPAISQIILDIVKRYADSDIDIPDIVHGSEIHDPAVIAKLLPLLPIAESWAAGMRQRSKSMVTEDGYDIPGYEMKERAGSKSIASARAAWDVVKDKMSIEEFLDQVQDIPFNAIADVIYAKAPRGNKTRAKNEFEDALRDNDALIDKPKTTFLAAIKS